MAVVSTITEVSKDTESVQAVLTGTGRRRATFTIRVTTGATTDTLDLASYDAKVTGIEGVEFQSVDEAVRATAPTWSGTTVTFAGHTGSGRTILRLGVYY